LEKVGEEATEVILAAKDAGVDDNGRNQVVQETADLWFHTMVMLSELGLSSQDVLDELGKRFGVGGLEEKASRQT
jgi:phosphoribosyl-ATP pyrophosphohydrolase